MGNIVYNKWRAIGIIGLIMATGIPVLLYILNQHNYYSNPLRMTFGSNDLVLVFTMLSNAEDTAEITLLLIICINILQTSYRHLIAAKITFWVMISTSIVSGTLILTGWVQYDREIKKNSY